MDPIQSNCANTSMLEENTGRDLDLSTLNLEDLLNLQVHNSNNRWTNV